MSELFKTMVSASSAYNERNDCVVKALAIVTDNEYATAHEVCRMAGRRRRDGMYVHHWLPLVETLGSKITKTIEHPRQPNGSGYTMKTILRMLNPKGRYLVRVKGHVAAVVNGEICDWTAGRQHRVLYVYEIDGGSEAPVVETPKRKPSVTNRPKRGTTCAYIWDVCYRMQQQSRSEIIAHLVENGIHSGTAATQYAKWNRYRKMM